MVNAIENIEMGRPLGDEGLVNCGVSCSVDLTASLRDWAASRDWKSDILRVTPVILGAGLALAAREPAAAASIVEPLNQGLQHLGLGEQIDPKLAQWIPPAIVETGAFLSGFLPGLQDVMAKKYQVKIDQNNAALKAQIQREYRLEENVKEFANDLVTKNKLKPDQLDEFCADKLETETNKLFDRDGRKAVKANWLEFATKEGFEMVKNLGGAGLLVSDSLIGMEIPRVLTVAALAISGLATLRRYSPQERLWSTTIVSKEE